MKNMTWSEKRQAGFTACQWAGWHRQTAIIGMINNGFDSIEAEDLVDRSFEDVANDCDF